MKKYTVEIPVYLREFKDYVGYGLFQLAVGEITQKKYHEIMQEKHKSKGTVLKLSDDAFKYFRKLEAVFGSKKQLFVTALQYCFETNSKIIV